MSHFWPFCFLISPSLKHIHICCVLFPSVFREKWAAISRWPPLFCTQDSFFSTVSTPPLHVRVWRKKKNFWYFPIFTPIIIPSLTFSTVLRDTLLFIEKQSGAIGAHKPFFSSMRHDQQTAGARPWARRVKGLLEMCVSSSAWTIEYV